MPNNWHEVTIDTDLLTAILKTHIPDNNSLESVVSEICSKSIDLITVLDDRMTSLKKAFWKDIKRLKLAFQFQLIQASSKNDILEIYNRMIKQMLELLANYLWMDLVALSLTKDPDNIIVWDDIVFYHHIWNKDNLKKEKLKEQLNNAMQYVLSCIERRLQLKETPTTDIRTFFYPCPSETRWTNWWWVDAIIVLQNLRTDTNWYIFLDDFDQYKILTDDEIKQICHSFYEEIVNQLRKLFKNNDNNDNEIMVIWEETKKEFYNILIHTRKLNEKAITRISSFYDNLIIQYKNIQTDNLNIKYVTEFLHNIKKQYPSDPRELSINEINEICENINTFIMSRLTWIDKEQSTNISNLLIDKLRNLLLDTHKLTKGHIEHMKSILNDYPLILNQDNITDIINKLFEIQQDYLTDARELTDWEIEWICGIFHVEVKEIINELNDFNLNDIIEKARKELQSAKLDPLTGLPNRYDMTKDFKGLLDHSVRTYYKKIKQIDEHPEKYKWVDIDALKKISMDDPDAYVIIWDIDLFKQVNDTHGHAVWDEVIRRTAITIDSSKRPNDKVYRLGGEEILISLRDTDFDWAIKFCENKRESIWKNVFIGNQWTQFSKTMSFWLTKIFKEEIMLYEYLKENIRHKMQEFISEKDIYIISDSLKSDLLDTIYEILIKLEWFNDVIVDECVIEWNSFKNITITNKLFMFEAILRKMQELLKDKNWVIHKDDLINLSMDSILLATIHNIYTRADEWLYLSKESWRNRTSYMFNAPKPKFNNTKDILEEIKKLNK